MKNFLVISILAFLLTLPKMNAQTPPWGNNLMIVTSSDGTTFSTPQLFQDSSGVPSMIQLSDGRLICAFQWFPAPLMGPGFDSVAVKISNDTGYTWSAPTQCIFTGMPGNFRRPFDPALIQLSTGQIRMYFSSGVLITPQLDSTVDTYSAISSDGLTYAFEGGIRYDDISLPVIDPTAVNFGGVMHYIAPRGAPQDGAFHATSLDGLTLTPLPTITSDAVHQWTGNLTVDGSTMRFYGAGTSGIWWSASTDGNTWSSYAPTNISGGDPSAQRLTDGSYIMVYVGFPNPASVSSIQNANSGINIFPNPSNGIINIKMESESNYVFTLFNPAGQQIISQTFIGNSTSFDVGELATGLYFVDVLDVERNIVYREKVVR